MTHVTPGLKPLTQDRIPPWAVSMEIISGIPHPLTQKMAARVFTLQSAFLRHFGLHPPGGPGLSDNPSSGVSSHLFLISVYVQFWHSATHRPIGYPPLAACSLGWGWPRGRDCLVSAHSTLTSTNSLHSRRGSCLSGTTPRRAMFRAHSSSPALDKF